MPLSRTFAGAAVVLTLVRGVTAASAAQQPTSRREPSPSLTASVSTSAGERLERAASSSNPVLSRRVTVQLRDVHLEDALKAIAAAADVPIAFSADVVPVSERVTVRIAGEELRSAIRSVLTGRNLDLLISSSGQLVVVAAAGSAPLAASSTRAPSQAVGTVSGLVTGAGGSPVVGASVAIAGSTRGAQTDAQGRYTITGIPAGSRTVRATFAGFAEVSRTVTVVAGQTATLNVQLTQQAVQLEEIVAIGYGTVRRRDLTGSIATVGGEEAVVRAAPTTAVANALQGKAPGVQVVSNSGAPGSGASVRIRGSNSITANSEPLYVVDGVPFGQGSSGTDNPLASIDPSNIESMQILKDASATAIYGARGANGVVLITTRRGQRGGAEVQVESSYGVQDIDRDIGVLNSQQFMTMANEANRNAGRAVRYTQADIDTAQTYDYLDMVLQTAQQQSHAVTVSGGDADSRFLVSGGYLTQEGVVIKTGFERYSARLNLDRNISSRFRIGTSLSGTQTIQNLGGGEDGGFNGGVVAALNFAPYVPPKDANGNWNKLAITSDQTGNPIANQMEIKSPQRATRILTSIFGEFDVLDQMRLRSTVAGNFGFGSNLMFAPRTVSAGGVGGVASRDERQSRELTNENTLTYNRELGPGTLDALAGFSVQTSHDEQTFAGASIFPVDAFEYYNLGAGSQVTAPTSNVTDWTLLSYLGRVNYNFLDRYLFTVTARRDGSSRFGENNKWAVFPSAAFAWRVIDEPFLQNQRVFSDLKFRLSYGRTGNQAVGQYASLARLGTNVLGLGASATPVITLAPTNAAPNPDLRWETQGQVNMGMDLGFLDNRVTLSADAYQTKTEDLLLTVNLAGVSGYASQLRNIGSVQNQGIEIALGTVNFEGDLFGWRSSLNVSTNRNEVLDIGEEKEIVTGNFLVRPGLPLSSIFGYEVDGLYQQGDVCTLVATADCAPGEYKLRDVDGNRIINNNDRLVLGHADPDFYGGFTNNFRLGAFSLDAFLNFSVGNEVVNITKQRNSLVRGVYNERTEVLNRWTPTNTNTMVPRANANRPNLLYSTLVEDATFLRLQTLTLGYQVPERYLPVVSAARLFLTGQNVWLFTDYTGFDPEVNRNGGDARQRGLDNNGIPRAKVWNLGANLTF
jgi:TonB-dependent starch-binding outer membrane protein SusC